MIIRILDKLKRELYRAFHPSLWGKNLQINGIPRIYDIKHLRLGRNVSINAGCVLQCYGGLIIGDNVTVSDGAKILTRELSVDNYVENVKLTEREHIDKLVSIDSGTWIATNAIVLPGVYIAANCIVAAGAIVTKAIDEECCLYGGVPAKKIRRLEE